MLLHFLKIFYNTKVLPLQSKLPAVSLTARQINYKRKYFDFNKQSAAFC